MLADITKALADVGVSICSCAVSYSGPPYDISFIFIYLNFLLAIPQSENVKGRGMAVILFQVEANLDNMVCYNL